MSQQCTHNSCMRLGLFLTSVLVLRISRRFNLRVIHMSTSCMQVKKLTELAVIPSRGSAFAAGFDLSSAYDLVVPKHGKAIVKTDIAIAIPENTYARIAPRSGLAVKNFIDVGAGVVDYDYRGNVGVVLFNHGDQDFAVARGDRVAQLVLERISMAGAQEVQELSDTSRGAGGFGSTGVAAHSTATVDPTIASVPSDALVSDLELVQVKKLTDLAIIPTRGSEYAAGFDLSSAYDLVIPKHGKAIVKTDLAIAIPVNTYARVAPRSGLAVKNFIDVGAGVVDYDYRGNVGVVLFNHGDQDFAVARGDRVAQLVLERISMAGAQEVQELSDTSRGAGGFGSTGVSGDAVADSTCSEGPDSAKRARVESPAATAEVSGQDNEVLFVKRLTDLATIPVRGSQFAAGFDLSSAYDMVVPKGGKAIVKTDIAVAVPEGTYARIAPRSGLAVKNFIDVGAGVVDYDYRGNVGVVLFNHGDQDFSVARGDRVAQLLLERISMAGAQEVQELSDTSRGAGGFGSTGVSGGAVTA